MLTPESERKTAAVERTLRFQLGQVVATPGALEALERAGVTPLRFALLFFSGGDLDSIGHLRGRLSVALPLLLIVG